MQRRRPLKQRLLFLLSIDILAERSHIHVNVNVLASF